MRERTETQRENRNSFEKTSTIGIEFTNYWENKESRWQVELVVN